MRNIRLKNLFRITALISISCATIILVARQNRDSSPASIKKDLASLNTRLLNQFSVVIENSAGDIIYQNPKLEFPLAEGEIAEEIIAAGQTAFLTYHFSRVEEEFLKRFPQINVHLPRMIHHFSRIRSPANASTKLYGYNASLIGSIASLDILEAKQKVLTIEVNYGAYPIFGPQDFPIILADPKDAGYILDLLHKPLNHMELRKELDLGLSFIIVILSFILAYNRLFSLLAYTACVYGLRSFYYYWTDIYGNFLAASVLGLVLNGLLILCSTLYFAHFYTYGTLKRKTRATIFLTQFASLIACFLVFSAEAFIYRSDLIADSLISTTGILIVFLSSRRLSSQDGIHALSSLKLACIKREKLAAMLLITALSLYGLINFFDLFRVSLSLPKNYSDFAHLIFMPSMFLITLFHGGSYKKNITERAQEAVQKKILETELCHAFTFQQSLLPGKSGQSSLFAWRTFYKSGSTLGGDWLTLVEIAGPTGPLILGGLFDVAGKGLQSAMLSTVITSSFKRFVLNYSRQPQNTSLYDPSSFLNKLTHDINDDLSLLSFCQGASGSLFLIDVLNTSLYYTTQGYHGFLLSEGTDTPHYLKTAGPAFGSPYFCPQVKQKSISLPCITVMLSDGFTCFERTPSAALQSLRLPLFEKERESAIQSLRATCAYLLQQYRSGLKESRKKNLAKDDAAFLTAVIFDPYKLA